MQKNCLALYKNQLAFICDFEQDKILISYYTQDKKGSFVATQKVRQKDLCLLDPRPATSLDHAIKALDCLLDEPIKQAWELLCTSCDSVPLKDLCDLILEANYKSDMVYAVFVKLKQSPYFVQDTKAFSAGVISFFAQSKQAVNDTLQKRQQQEAYFAKRQDFIKRLKALKIDPIADAKYMQDIEALALGLSDKSKTLEEAHISQTQEEAHKILLATGLWTQQKNPWPCRFGVSLQSANISLLSPPPEKRVAIDAPCFAIDAPYSTDPDDAIGFDGKYYWVHVADPACSVTPDCKIDIQARNRGATLYAPEITSRMLCESCLKDYALGLQTPSIALSFKILLDENANIIDTQVLKTLVNVKRLSYEQAQEQKDTPALSPLFDMAKKLYKKRCHAGCIEINIPSVDIKVNDGTVEITPEKTFESNFVVKEFMLLAGEAAAKFCFKNKIAFPYISQAAPDLPNTKLCGLALQFLLRKSMKPRSVGVEPMAHSGLGLAMYSQVTSPLRRYGDLVSHQQLCSFLSGGKLQQKDELLEKISAGDAATRGVLQAERKSRLHWTLVYLLQHPNWSANAIVVDKKQGCCQCFCPDIGLDFMLGEQNLELNQEVKVKAQKICLYKLESNFALV